MVNSTQDTSIKDESSGYYARVTSDGKLETTSEITLAGGTFVQAPPISFTGEYQGTQTNIVVLTPTAGKHFVIYGVLFDGDASGPTVSIELHYGTGGGKALIWKTYGNTNLKSSWLPLKQIGGTDVSIYLTTTGYSSQKNMVVGIAYDELD